MTNPLEAAARAYFAHTCTNACPEGLAAALRAKDTDNGR